MDTISGFASGSEVFWLAQRFESPQLKKTQASFWIHVASSDEAASHLADIWTFIKPDVPVFILPSLGPLTRTHNVDLEILLPYTQVFTHAQDAPSHALMICTPDALWRKLPQKWITHPAYTVIPKQTLRPNILETLNHIGYTRTDIVHIPGDYAVRGSLIDVFPADDKPVRLDFFGDDLECIKTFDPITQRATGTCPKITVGPLHGFSLNELQIHHLTQTLCHTASTRAHDLLSHLQRASYQRGITPELMCAWPLIDTMAFWPTHLRIEGVSFSSNVLPDPSLEEKNTQTITTRLHELSSTLNLEDLWCTTQEWKHFCQRVSCKQFNTLEEHTHSPQKPPLGFKSAPQTDKALSQLEHLQNKGRVLLTAPHQTGYARWQHFLKTHQKPYQTVSSWKDFQKLPTRTFALAKAPWKQNFEGGDWSLICEDGFWPYRPQRRSARRGEQVLSDFTTLTSGDYVTHEDHGIGQYEGLETLDVGGVMHDCLKIIYSGGDRLFVPVENMSTLSRYGAEETAPSLDRLGSNAWQVRKQRVQKKAIDLAHGLLQTAAKRKLQNATAFHTQDPEALETFEQGFPFLETEDQLRAIEDTLADLSQEAPMDRLVCGDVGFGKTEVALRAAFMVASNGKQVAVVVPTTLLARQHGRNFTSRFAHTNLRVATLSRLTLVREAKKIKEELAQGTVHIVVATHALLSDTIRFKDLGLLVIDEEQHFGVSHKEKLKKLKADLHVLTLTATPIPRTLHMALSDLKALSLITTPPVDRKAVMTNVASFRKSLLKEALLKEKERSGQSFVICPRLTHLEKLKRLLPDLLPSLRFGVAHGSLNRQELENTMSDFENGAIDVLLSTNIVESGIDITRANTLVIYRADLFGLANLYQLRGRIGRGQTQGVAHFFLDENKIPTPQVQRRLEVMQSLDYLGAGFAVASHDMDIRGTGNLVGSEQSGHIREVGVSYYQKLLCEAMQSLQKDAVPTAPEAKVTFPGSVLLPPSYVSALDVRLGIYQRLSNLSTLDDADSMREEWADRFGPVPEEAENLIRVTRLKIAARAAWVSHVDVGKKATALSFVSPFPHPEKLLHFIHKTSVVCKLTSDQRLVIPRQNDLDQHLKALHAFLKELTHFVSLKV